MIHTPDQALYFFTVQDRDSEVGRGVAEGNALVAENLNPWKLGHSLLLKMFSQNNPLGDASSRGGVSIRMGRGA
jgi:hypothetical protein